MKRARLLHTFLVLVVAAAAAGCQGDLTVKNGPAGDERLTWAPPWNTQPKSSRVTTRTSTAPTSCAPAVVEERDECEGDACRTVPPAK